MKPQQKDFDKKKKFKLKDSKCLLIWFKYMYDQLLRASDNAMRASSFFHPQALQGEWVKKFFLHPCMDLFHSQMPLHKIKNMKKLLIGKKREACV